MTKWYKKEIPPEVIKEISSKYTCDLLTASILARRNIEANEMLFFFEDDTRFLHNPFLFVNMEDAVDRICTAKDEGEKVLIFGDRDVDGITSTALLFNCLKKMQIDVQWRIPTGNDSYGLTMQAIDDFAADYGSLIITVDCGISNNAEIAYATEKGISVIIVDHHNPQNELPNPAIIIDPKIKDCGYPFDSLAGCGVTYKLVNALKFSQTELYKEPVCLLNVRPVNDAYSIDCIKIVNMCETARMSETIIPGTVSITQTRLLPFLQGQQIFVWEENLQRKLLAKIFGAGVDFNFFDIRAEVEKLIPAVRGQSLLKLSSFSKIAKYSQTASGEIDAFFNLFVTFIQKKTQFQSETDAHDLQLVMLATLADMMPLKNENRILVRQGLNSLNNGKARPGLVNLLSKQGLLGKKIGTANLAFKIIPVLNAAGRLGQPELALHLFLEEDTQKQDELASQIIRLNEERKQIGDQALLTVEQEAFKSLSEYGNKLVVVVDERVHRGITGIVASNMVQRFNVPVIIITKLDENTQVGSVRSTRGYDVTDFLEQCADLFLNHGGHNFAAGFSLNKKNLSLLLSRFKNLSQLIELSNEEEKIAIDAELPYTHLTPEIQTLIEKFEPYGLENPPLIFTAKKLKITAADIMGKPEPKHLKLTFDCGKHKWAGVFWNAADRIKRDFTLGDFVDAVFTVERNSFNGAETLQMMLQDVQKCV